MKLGSRSLDCDRACDMMFDYIDTELNDSDKIVFEAHIKDCDSCRRELCERREMLELIKLAGETPTPSLYTEVMDGIAGIPKQKQSIFARLRYLPAGTLVAACAVMMVLVVGRSYIFGGASIDAVENEAVVERYAADKDAILADDAGVTAAVGSLSQGGEPVLYAMMQNDAAADVSGAAEPEVYSVTTSSITADAPMLFVGNSTVSYSAAQAEQAVMTKSNSTSRLDVFFGGLETDGKAIIVCYDGALVIDEALVGTDLTSEDGLEYVLYTVTEDAFDLFTEHLEFLSNGGSDYRALFTESEDVLSYELYVLTTLES